MTLEEVLTESPKTTDHGLRVRRAVGYWGLGEVHALWDDDRLTVRQYEGALRAVRAYHTS